MRLTAYDQKYNLISMQILDLERTIVSLDKSSGFPPGTYYPVQVLTWEKSRLEKKLIAMRAKHEV